MAQKSIKNGSKWVPKNAHFCDANLADVIILFVYVLGVILAQLEANIILKKAQLEAMFLGAKKH